MVFLKVLFLLLLAIPFFLFLLYIVDKLMDELPKKSISKEKGKRVNDSEYSREKKEHNKSNLTKRQRRKARRQN